ncbi:MAG: aminotransferase class IV [Polyangiaceae bacterium]
MLLDAQGAKDISPRCPPSEDATGRPAFRASVSGAAALANACAEVIAANRLGNAYLRPIVYFDEGGLGLDVAPLKAHSFVAAMPWKSHLGDASERGVKLKTTTWRRTPSSSLPPLKICGGYTNAILAKREATSSGYDEALFVDERGFVCEATGENLFLVKKGKVIAPTHPDALPGITRATIVELTRAEERPVTVEELREADEIFLTGTSAEVAAVGLFDGREMPRGPATREISAMYQALVHGETSMHRDWLFEILFLQRE